MQQRERRSHDRVAEGGRPAVVEDRRRREVQPQHLNQQQLRQAFTGPAEVSPLEVEVGGRKLRATRVVMHPFRDDPRIERFPKFRDKAYEFVVTPEVPGGLYRIATSTPDPKGEVVLAESVTFERADARRAFPPTGMSATK